jgi:hypothetical protein
MCRLVSQHRVTFDSKCARMISAVRFPTASALSASRNGIRENVQRLAQFALVELCVEQVQRIDAGKPGGVCPYGEKDAAVFLISASCTKVFCMQHSKLRRLEVDVFRLGGMVRLATRTVVPVGDPR